MTKQWEIAIVGGTGGMGQIFAKELKPFADVIIISRSLEKAEKISKKIGVRGGILKDCSAADIIVVSAPIESTYNYCLKLLQIMKPGSLLIDISAVKAFIDELKDEIPNHLSYISMHPLFGPEGRFRDFNVILIPIKDEKNWLSNVEELLHKLGATTAITTPADHDLIMSKVQVAHHFIYLLLAFYLGDIQIPPNFFTRSFRKTLERFKGIATNLNTVLEIQKANPHAKTTRKELSSIIEQFVSFDDETKLKELQNKIESFKKNYLQK